eukprot:m.47421 g.47421  ORF g.47421 m.47421 type:complete len:52 (-) comp7329_c2_seq1:45-200(-)
MTAPFLFFLLLSLLILLALPGRVFHLALSSSHYGIMVPQAINISNLFENIP